ncbi:MAG: ABC-type transport auxiliary lipoprotein family protein [Myxococcota bacterium]
MSEANPIPRRFDSARQPWRRRRRSTLAAPLVVLVLHVVAGGGLLAGCRVLPGQPAPAPRFFTLQPDFARAVATPAEAERAGSVEATAILVAPPDARPGFDGRRMAYVQRPFELRYFARHQWVEPPARLLEPLVAVALERGGAFRAVSSGALVDPTLRLETEIVALQQEFDATPSRVRFVLAARLVDRGAARLVASTELEALEPAESADPYGGVVAANRAVGRVLEALAAWCTAEADGVALGR